MNSQVEKKIEDTSRMERRPKVSVCVVTYNQEKYIGQCLQSLVDQKTNFDFEIIVGDDCSTDGTREIVRQFQEKYPNLIFPIYHEKNIGPVQNVLSVYRAARGKYICHMDGDDYALPGKLQIQSDVLDKNLDCVICSHDMYIVNSDGKIVKNSFVKRKSGKNSIIDLYSRLPFFAHSSKMFVNDMSDSFWNNLHPKALDIEIHVQQAKKGLIYHLSDRLGCYRQGVGISSSCGFFVNPDSVQAAKRIYTEAIDSYLDEQENIKKYYARAMLNHAYQSAIFGDVHGIKEYAKHSMNICKFSNIQQLFLFLPPRLTIFACRARSFLKSIL